MSGQPSRFTSPTTTPRPNAISRTVNAGGRGHVREVAAIVPIELCTTVRIAHVARVAEAEACCWFRELW